MIRLFTFIVFFICFISTSVLSHTIDLSDQLQSIQSKLEALNSSDETIQKKNLKEIYLKSQRVLLDHQTYLTKTQHYSEQLANFPQQLENLEQQKNNVNLAQPNLSELRQLTLSEMVQRNIETQAKLSEYQNQQQKILSEIATLREQTVTNHNELAAANSARNAKSAELLPELDLNDENLLFNEKKTDINKKSVPAGMLPGDDQRLAGQGEPATAELAAGDLYLTILVRSHPLFQLRGRALHFAMPASALALMAGDEIRLPTLGKPVSLTLDPGPPDAREVRIPGKGYPVRGRHQAGDLVARLDPVFPATLTARQRKMLLKAIAALMDGRADALPEIAAWNLGQRGGPPDA